MKPIIFSALIALALTACNDDDKGTGDRTYDLNTPATANPSMTDPHNIGDTTPTTNNNIYNTDSNSIGSGTDSSTGIR